MVGDPKRLSDLNKIEADVRITCRRCRFEEDWTVQALAQHLSAIGGSQVWSEITRHMHCRRFGCGSSDLRAIPVPYARRQANLPRRVGRLDQRIITSALAILEGAVRNERRQAVNTIDVRLALLVLHRYARAPEAIRLFWDRAGITSRTVNESLSDPLAKIHAGLVKNGWLQEAVLLDGPKTWPWNSPAPPGWLKGPAQADHE